MLIDEVESLQRKDKWSDWFERENNELNRKPKNKVRWYKSKL